MKGNKINKLLWVVYLALLAVLLPHTAWAFSLFEPEGLRGSVTAWCAAFAFEAAIAALTHKLARHIESVRSGKRRFARRYLNAYASGLLIAVGVSTLANLAHAVEFGQTLTIYGSGSALTAVYSLAFGAILPAVSLLFARVLSNVQESEVDVDPALDKANETIRQLRSEARDVRAELAASEQRVAQVELKFGQVAGLFADGARERIKAVRDLWPDEPQAFWAKAARCAPSTVSEIVRSGNGRGGHAEDA